MRPEDKLQKQVAEILDMGGLVWSATANGAFLNGDAKQRAIRGMRMKEHGVKNGLPDCLIFDKFFIHYQDEERMGANRNGLAIELKVGKNKPTPAQLKWHEDLRRCGWRVDVCYNIDEVLKVLRECYPSKFPE